MRKSLIVNLSGILSAFLICGVVMQLQGYPAIESYAALFNQSVGSSYAFLTVLKNSIPLVLTGLSASVAFSSGPVNLGQPGQFLIGGLFATIGGLFVELPAPLMIPFMLLLAMIGGALWSFLAAVMKQLFDMDEYITTLMLNMIADLFTYWAISYPFFETGATFPQTPKIVRSGWMPSIGKFNSGIIVMLLVFIVVWFIYYRTTAGYEWRMTGQNPTFARLGGVPTRRNYLMIMLVTGALAGLAGGLVVMTGPRRFIKGIGANYAWDGIMVSMVANNNLFATLLYGIFFSMLETGSLGMELFTKVPSEMVTVLKAIIVLVVMAGRGSLEMLIRNWMTRQKMKARAEG